MNELVSICIPAYNNEVLLRAALDSIEKQTYRNYEIIITDDSTSDAVESVVQAHPVANRVRYFRNEARLGSPANWNACIGRATGDYIKVMHHDDIFTSEASLSVFVQALTSNPQVDMVFSNSVNLRSDGTLQNIHRPSPAQLRQMEDRPTELLHGNFIGAPSATLLRREASIPFDERMVWFVDIDWYVRLLLGGHRILHIDRDLVGITVGSDAQMTRKCDNDADINISEYLMMIENIRAQEKIGLLEKAKFLDILCRFGYRPGKQKISYRGPEEAFLARSYYTLRTFEKLGRFVDYVHLVVSLRAFPLLARKLLLAFFV